MSCLKAKLLRELTRHFGWDIRRIEHALEVLWHAEALLEETPEANPEIVMAAAITHDFGIREAERRYGQAPPAMQEEFGPRYARAALERVGMSTAAIDEVCDIVGHHHSRPDQPSLHFQLLYEADWLVNIREYPNLLESPKRLQAFISRNFETPAGLRRARGSLLHESGTEAIFEKMGNVYTLLVDEKARAKREKPFLLEMADEARRAGAKRKKKKQNSLVIDLASGTGLHARILGQEGYPVLGMDKSHALLDQARQFRNPRMIAFRWGDLLTSIDLEHPCLSGKKKASLALLLGNTLSVFREHNQRLQVARHIADSLLPGGLWVCQTLNYAPFLDGEPRVTSRHGMVNERETLVTKTLRISDKGDVIIQIAAGQRNGNGQWDSATRTSTLSHLEPCDIQATARKAGFAKMAHYGNYEKSKFSRAVSQDSIFVFQKKAQA